MKDRSHLFTAMSLSHVGAALLNPGRKLSSEAPMTSARVFHRPINVKIPSLTDSKTTRLKIFDQVSKQSFLDVLDVVRRQNLFKSIEADGKSIYCCT